MGLHTVCLLILTVLAGLYWVDCRSDASGAIREVSVEILAPRHGSSVRHSDPKGLQIHVRILGMEIPKEGNGVVFLDGQTVATMPENEVFFDVEGIASLAQGEHTLVVRLHDEQDEPLGAEQSSVFQVIADVSEGAKPEHARSGSDRFISWAGVDSRRASSCVMDPTKTTADGAGLEAVSAGMSSEFAIHPRDADGRLIDPRDCPEPLSLLVVIKPAPFEHRMSRGEDGLYYCMWVAEYAGDVQVDVQLRADTDIHIQGSPFQVRVHQMYNVEVEQQISVWCYRSRYRTPYALRGTELAYGARVRGTELAYGASRPQPSEFNGHYLHSSREARHHLPAYSGALTLFFSLRKTGTSRPFVAVAPRGTLSEASRATLSSAGMTIVEVKGMRKQDISDMSEARWNDNYSKLRLWQLPYKKIIFLDADMIVLQPLDHLFALEAEFAAVPDAFHPCYLNTGFMVIGPNNASFSAMAALIDEVSSEESEQTLVNHWYLDRYHVLHYTYNFAKHNVMSPTRFQIYVERYMDTVKVVHYLGVKPWQCSRDRDCMRHVPYYGGPSNMYLYDLWWSMFDELCDQPGVACVAHGE